MRVLLLLSVLLVTARASQATDAAVCLRPAGHAGAKCLTRWLRTVETCRRQQDTACETLARATGGALDQLVSAANAATGGCSEATATALGYQSLADVGLRNSDACGDWGEAFLDLSWSPAANLSGRRRECL